MTIRSWIANLFAVRKPGPCRTTPARRRLALEALEDRTLPSSTIWYVNDAAAGSNNGLSWANAFTSLQSALADAQSGDQIWVAQGTYMPTSGSDRTVSFALDGGVA